MDTKKYRTQIKLYVTPVWHAEPPICAVRFSKDIFFNEEIKETNIYSYEEYLPAGDHHITIEFLNKKNTDTVAGKDKAILIDKIVFNGIESSKFVSEGIYRPIYPEPWVSQQKKLGKKLNEIVKPATYLGWNGLWKLTYCVPIYTWIHNLENHGWIYD